MTHMVITDPIYHGAADVLDDGHLMAWESQHCVTCSTMVHAFNNECMTGWFETFYGPMCFECFAAHPLRDDLPGPGSSFPADSVVHGWATDTLDR